MGSSLGQYKQTTICDFEPDLEPTRHGGRQDGLSHQPLLQQAGVELAREHVVPREVDVGVRVGGMQEPHRLEALCAQLLVVVLLEVEVLAGS